jgi:pimeloyl-ACP methyl ester carboxylesterase
LPFREELVDIGGRRLHVTCAGEGSPTIVLEAGMGDTLATWASIQGRLAEMTTVLSYTRAGLGRSDPAPLPRSIQDMVTDLGNLLSAVAVPGPYVLVAHSYGGQIARLFAAQHPLETKAMVLVDPSHEDKYARFEAVLTEQLIERQGAFVNDPSRNSEHIDLLESRRQMNAASSVLNIPMVVLTRGMTDEQSSVWPSPELQKIERQMHLALLKVPGFGLRKHIIAEHSGHFIHHDEPELVISAVREAMKAARTES